MQKNPSIFRQKWSNYMRRSEGGATTLSNRVPAKPRGVRPLDESPEASGPRQAALFVGGAPQVCSSHFQRTQHIVNMADRGACARTGASVAWDPSAIV